jgi:hypothetical protein
MRWRRPRITILALMVAIAATATALRIGVELIRKSKRSEIYRRNADRFASEETIHRDNAVRVHNQVAFGTSAGIQLARARSDQDLRLARQRARLEKYYEQLEQYEDGLADYYRNLASKYRRASVYPWAAVPSDLPPPGPPPNVPSWEP